MAEVQQAPAAAAAAVPGPVVIDTQHDDMVHDSQLDYYGTKLATASSGTLYLLLCTFYFGF
jgi:protein transport protein SEC13